MGYVSHAQRKAVHASKAEKKSPVKAKNLKEVVEQLERVLKLLRYLWCRPRLELSILTSGIM